MHILVIGAMPEEIEKFVRDSKAKKKKLLSLEYYEFDTTSHTVFVACCGIGKVNAACTTQKMIDISHPTFVINIGVAGGIKSGIGDVVIAQETFYHDFDLRLFGYEMGQVPHCPSRFQTPPVLLDFFLETARLCFGKTPTSGAIATGDCFVQSDEKKQMLLDKNAVAVDMESTAIAQTCYANELPFIAVRSISDSADDGAQDDYENSVQKSSDKVGDFLRYSLNELEQKNLQWSAESF